MNAKWSTLVLVGGLMLLLVACSDIGTPTLADETLPSPAETLSIDDLQTESIPTLTTQESQKDNTQMAQPSLSSSLESLVEKAKEDLAKRLYISTTQIDLVEIKDVVWPNSSLGYPLPGMVYAEVLTPGYLILLAANSKEYEYHASKDAEVIYCENPTPPVPNIHGDI